MRLIIKRGYVDGIKGLFGGSTRPHFTFYCKVELTQEEKILIAKYKIELPSLTNKTLPGQEYVGVSPTYIVDGIVFNAKDLNELAAIESIIMESCKNFQSLIDNLKLIGTQSVIDFSN